MSRAYLLACVGLVSLVVPVDRVRADEASAVATLKAKGIVKTGSLALAADSELSKKLKDDFKLKKNVQLATQALQTATAASTENDQAMTALNAQLIVANRNGDTAANNAIVGELNLRNDQRKELSKAESEARAKANAALEEYVTFVVEARRLADKITHDYKLLAEDKDVGSAIDELNKATGKTFALTESKTLQASLKMLKRIEDQVLSDEIPLKAQSNTFHVATTLNGKYPKDMLVDSGASLILIPDKVAKEIDLFVPEDAKPLKLKLADGRIIDGKLIQLASVRVGRFEIENVDAAVLGPDFPSAEPLLGMSFLQNFNFKIDADAAKLTMTKIDDSSKGAKAAPAKGAPAKPGKK